VGVCLFEGSPVRKGLPGERVAGETSMGISCRRRKRELDILPKVGKLHQKRDLKKKKKSRI